MASRTQGHNGPQKHPCLPAGSSFVNRTLPFPMAMNFPSDKRDLINLKKWLAACEQNFHNILNELETPSLKISGFHDFILKFMSSVFS